MSALPDLREISELPVDRTIIFGGEGYVWRQPPTSRRGERVSVGAVGESILEIMGNAAMLLDRLGFDGGRVDKVLKDIYGGSLEDVDWAIKTSRKMPTPLAAAVWTRNSLLALSRSVDIEAASQQ